MAHGPGGFRRGPFGLTVAQAEVTEGLLHAGLAVALDGKTPKKLGLAPRVRSENPETRRNRAGCALKNAARSTGPRCAEY